MPNPMGIGNVGKPDVIFKRKFRYTLELTTPSGKVPPSYVKLASRPQLEIDETEINFLNATTYVPGKGKWQPLSVTYLDVSHDTDMDNLYQWILTVHDFNDSVNLKNSEKAGWDATASIIMYDGCGTPLEEWTLGSCWPQSVNFGDLDNESSEISTIDLTLRFSTVVYEKKCKGNTPKPTHVGCK